MNSRGTFKSKSQISNYLYKQKNKQKSNSNSTSNNTILSEKDNNNKIIVDSFRKGSVKQNSSALNKFKTGKNSRKIILYYIIVYTNHY